MAVKRQRRPWKEMYDVSAAVCRALASEIFMRRCELGSPVALSERSTEYVSQAVTFVLRPEQGDFRIR